MTELSKVIEFWHYVAEHEKGKISKGMSDTILATIKLLEELKSMKEMVEKNRLFAQRYNTGMPEAEKK